MIKDCFIVKLNIGFDFKKKKLERRISDGARQNYSLFMLSAKSFNIYFHLSNLYHLAHYFTMYLFQQTKSLVRRNS